MPAVPRRVSPLALPAVLVLASLCGAVACSSTPHRDEIDPRPPPDPVPTEALAACDQPEPLDAALCRLEVRLEHARRRHDTVLSSCLHDSHQRLVRIRAARRTEDAGAVGDRLGDVMIEREVLRLDRAAEDCGG